MLIASIFLFPARTSELEAKLQEAQEELSEVQINMGEELGRAHKAAKAEMKREVDQYQARAASAAKDAEILKAEVSLQVKHSGSQLFISLNLSLIRFEGSLKDPNRQFISHFCLQPVKSKW